MTTVTSVGSTAPAAVPAPLAAVADRPFAYVLHGLIEAQLARSSAEPAPPAAPAAPAPAVDIPPAAVTVGPNGPTTITAFRFWHRVLPIGADS